MISLVERPDEVNVFCNRSRILLCATVLIPIIFGVFAAVAVTVIPIVEACRRW